MKVMAQGDVAHLMVCNPVDLICLDPLLVDQRDWLPPEEQLRTGKALASSNYPVFKGPATL